MPHVFMISRNRRTAVGARPFLIAWKERESGYRARGARIKEMMGLVPPFPEDNVVARVEGEDDGGPGSEGSSSGEAGGRDEVAGPALDTDFSGDGEQQVAEPDPEADENLSAEELAERQHKREVRARRKARRQARKRGHGRPR